MPAQQAVAANGNPQQGQRQGAGNVLGFILRMGVMWYLMSWFKGSPQSKDPKEMTHPVFSRGTVFDMYAYLSEASSPYILDDLQLVWKEDNVGLATSPERAKNITYTPSEGVLNNASVYMHLYFVLPGVSHFPDDDNFDHRGFFTVTGSLTRYLPKPKQVKGVNLLSDAPAPKEPLEEVQEEKADGPWVNFWKPNATINIIDHFNAYPKKSIPQPIFESMKFDEAGNYFPLVVFNDFWLLRDKMIQINETTTNLTLSVTMKALNQMWWQLQKQMEQSFQMQMTMGLTQDGESDEFKRILIEGNPYLLALTFCVSMMHTVVEFLAFKSDIGFWKNNKSMEGLSARSILINAACQCIIFLYLLDNETSFVVLLSSGAGLAIEFWKVTKAMDVKLLNKFPFLSIKDKASYKGNKTKQYDEEATRYLSYVLYPLIVGYSIYALINEKHKSWYSWVLNSLVGAVYTFGFILMCPQLYLNYKLKSVAHLPWRQMTYKFLNTIIDDLFAFVIKMPLLHRLSVFRDDVIFLIFLYQRWIYPTDKTRVNEFGYTEVGAEGHEAAAEQVEGAEHIPQIEGAALLQAAAEQQQEEPQKDEPTATKHKHKTAEADNTAVVGEGSKKAQ